MKVFKAACMIPAVAICVFMIPELFENSIPLAVGAVAFLVSPLSMQMIARTLEDRWMWPPSSQFNAFIYGDSFFLPIVAASEAAIFQSWGGREVIYDWFGWVLGITAIAFAITAANRVKDELAYSKSRFNSPTKIWHDLFVVPILLFLLIYPIPALFYVDVGFFHILGGVALTIWIVLMFDPGSLRKLHTAHLPFDWETKKTTSARN